jgi:hypothetical protein
MALNRPDYRDAKTPRAVTVYTIAQESRHLLVTNIPALSGDQESIIQDLVTKCGQYGTVETWRLLDDNKHDTGSFTLPPLLVTLATIDEARWMKRRMDDKVFYANLLQVAYAPDYDSVADLRAKVANRHLRVYKHLQSLSTTKRRTIDQVQHKDPPAVNIEETVPSAPKKVDTSLSKGNESSPETSKAIRYTTIETSSAASASKTLKRRRI